jgi:hypothetical protein
MLGINEFSSRIPRLSQINIKKQIARVHPSDILRIKPDYEPNFEVVKKTMAVSLPNYGIGSKKQSVFDKKRVKELAFVFNHDKKSMSQRRSNIFKK